MDDSKSQGLRDREPLFQTLFESSLDAIFIEDMVGNVLDCNPAAAALHGTSRENIIGRNVSELVPPNRRSEVRTLSTGTPPVEFRRANDELELRVQNRTAALERANEILRGEIAERNLAEEARRRLEEEIQASHRMDRIYTKNLDTDGRETTDVDIESGRYVMFAVEDIGCGMDSETLSHVFEPFFTTKDKSKGTGLGLSTVYGIVKQSGGYISASSRPDRGSTFKVYLPGFDRPAEPLDSQQLEAPDGTETILLTEDADLVRQLAREILEVRGFHVIEASDGEQALQICKTYPGTIHLTLTDVVMQRMNGRELAEQAVLLRRDMKVLLMSGYADEISKAGFFQPGLHFIEKPFTSNSLALKIREVLDRRTD